MHRQRHKKSSSFDTKLAFAFFLGLMIQISLPINGVIRIFFAMVVFGYLTKFAIKYREKYQWRWQGLTAFNLFRSFAILIFGCYWLSRYIVGVSKYINHSKGILDNPLDVFQEAIHVLPALLASTDPAFVYCLIPCGWLIFYLLVSLKLAYLSEEEFLKDCLRKDTSIVLTPNQINKSYRNTQAKSIFVIARDFFTSRPFIVKKDLDSVRVEFFKISSQDIRVKSDFIIYMSIFSFFCIFGLSEMLVGAFKGYLDYPDSPEYVKYISLTSILLTILLMILVPAWIWNGMFRIIFTKRIIEFNAKELVVSEKLLGKSFKIFGIDQKNLLPLIEIKKRTDIPEVKNSALFIQKRGGGEELAGQLLPEAMEMLQNIYDLYRISAFNSFYVEIKPVNLK
jgi:hypothetical protein